MKRIILFVNELICGGGGCLPRSAAFGILLTVLAIGCSVKESRDDCQTSVEFDFSKIALDKGDSLHFSLSSQEGLIVHSYDFAHDEIPAKLTFSLTKGLYKVRSYYGFEKIGSKGGEDGSNVGFTVRAGKEFPKFYAYGTDLTVSDTPWRDTVSYSKRYCNIEFVMAYDGDLHPYSVIVHGNIAGYDNNFQPQGGTFRFNATDRHCSIPAQIDGSLSLELRDDNNLSRQFAIGQMIIASGYNWKARDLEDIVITLEYSTLHIKIGVDDWSETYEFIIEL